MSRINAALASVVLAMLACSTTDHGSPSGNGGNVSVGVGGSIASGGATGTLGGASGGSGQTIGMAGGKSSAGAGGAIASLAVPSAGCGKAGRPPNGEISIPNDRIYDFPASYDGNKPMPLLFGLHGANNQNTTMQKFTVGTLLETNFVRAFPKSTDVAWVYGPADNDHITAIYNDLLANYCIDTSRIFITGHSSGAQMITKMLCGGETRFKAVAPVAASKTCDKFAPVPVMYIQGTMDAMRQNSNGADVVAMFALSNSCSSTTLPDGDVPTCNSTFDQLPVTPGCITYQNCQVPTIWCSHNDNSYNLSTGHMHGWPCFASNAMADFFLGLP